MNILLPQPPDAQDDYLWFTTQAALVKRALDAGALPPAIDWPGIVEELEALGRSELHAVESHLEVALLHLLKLACWPAHPARRQWTLSISHGLAGAKRRWSPGMVRLIEIETVFANAQIKLEIIGPDYGEASYAPVSILPLTLPALLAMRPDAAEILALAERFRAPA